METYAKALLYAIPFFIVLLIIEISYGHFVKKQTYTVMDTVSSLSSGLTNIIKDSLGLIFILVSYPFLLQHLALFQLEPTWYTYCLGFIAIDFAGYWNHRLCHKVNVFWNIHVIHHSSEEFNLACALRQSISNWVGYMALLLIPAAILGVPYKVIAILTPIHLFAQFWYHTKHIGKLGFLEYIIVTPSQHRVHHAINDIYIDKNLGQIFCAWDRLFGTFQEELDDVPPVYGVLKPANTWNPVIINFQHIWRIAKDAWRTERIWDKLRIWFMPTGWRPTDVATKYPIEIIKDPYSYTKYSTPASTGLKTWAVFRFISSLILLLYMFSNYSKIGDRNLLLFGLILFLGIYAYTSLMDRSKYTIVFESLHLVVGVSLILLVGDWSGFSNYITNGHFIMIAYLILSFMGMLYFTYVEKENDLKLKSV